MKSQQEYMKNVSTIYLFSQFLLNFPSMPFSSDLRMLISQQSSTTPVRPAESINTKTEVFFMRELRNTKIIAVDHGYGNMKTANTVTPTGIKAYETEPIFTGNILEYNDIYYRIGKGHKEFIPDKAMDEEYYLLTLMAIARELNVFSIREADVHLAAGLPLTWIRNQREAFRSYLLQNPEVRYLFNGKEYHLHFVGCSLYPQGYPAIVNQLGDFKGTNLLADIGNGTMNILYINNKKAQESRCWTEKLGVNQCMIAAKNAVLDKFGVKIEGSTVEQILRFGTADISAPYLDCISSIARQYVAELFSTLRKYEYNPDLMRLYVVGGGGCLIRNFGTYDKSRVTIIDDICATAKGYEWGIVIIRILVLIHQSMFQWIVQERIVVARPLILFVGFRVHFLSLSNFFPDMILVFLYWLQYLLGISFDFLAKGHPS
jgi:plasmid segregation protein ParM